MSAQPTFSDALSRFVFEAGPVRGALVSLDSTCAEILACHSYPPALAQVLSELLAAAALLASSLKFDGSIIVQLQGDGPVRLLVVECDASLTLRAMAQWSDEIDRLPRDASLAVLAGGAKGRLVITLDPRNGEPLYQGIVALEAASIAALIEHYLETSEQIPSRMLIAREEERVRGMLLQKLPGADEPLEGSGISNDALWRHASLRAGAIDPATLLAAASPADLLMSAFPEDDLRLFRSHPARFGCSCSQQRVENALRLVGREEVEDILSEQGEVSVTCEFCNRRYAFAPEDARGIFDARPRGGASSHVQH